MPLRGFLFVIHLHEMFDPLISTRDFAGYRLKNLDTAPRVHIDERAIPSSIDSGARGIAAKFQIRQQGGRKNFAPRSSITRDRRLVNGFDHPEFSCNGGFFGDPYVKM